MAIPPGSHKAIALAGLFIDRPEDIGCILDITHRELLEEIAGSSWCCFSSFNAAGVVAAAGNGLFKMAGLEVTPRNPS